MGSLPCANALSIKARLLILFDADKLIVARKVFGDVMVYASFIPFLFRHIKSITLRPYLCLIARPKDTSWSPEQ